MMRCFCALEHVEGFLVGEVAVVDAIGAGTQRPASPIRRPCAWLATRLPKSCVPCVDAGGQLLLADRDQLRADMVDVNSSPETC